MNARVFTLVLVSAVFMCVWNADHRAMEHSLAKKLQRHDCSSDLQAATSVQDVQLHSSKAITEQLETEPAQEVHAHVGTVAGESSASDTMPFSMTTALMIITSTQSSEFVQSLSETVIPATVEEVSSNLRSESDSELLPIPADIGEHQHELSAGHLIAALSDFAVVMLEHHDQGLIVSSTSENADEPIAAELETVENEVQNVPEPSASAGQANVESGLAPVSGSGNEEDPHRVPQPAISLSEHNSSIIPLPRNLASGTWQVMTQSGEFFRITIDRSSFSGAPTQAQTEAMEEQISVVTTDEGVRWCFIRFNSETPDAARRVATEFFAPVQN